MKINKSQLGYRSILAGMLLLISSCANYGPTKITRHTLNPWELEIGYAGVVQVGNTFYISGVACEGPEYLKAVGECYRELQTILDKLNLTSKNIVKENVYAIDIEQFKLQIEQRKIFYGNSNYPAATWIQASRLYHPNHLLEIELIAVK